MIFQNVPVLDGNEKKYVLDCIDSNWISSEGKYVKEFERFFADYCDTSHGVACSSGTSALHLALAALGIGAGDEVIVPYRFMVITPSKSSCICPQFIHRTLLALNCLSKSIREDEEGGYESISFYQWITQGIEFNVSCVEGERKC